MSRYHTGCVLAAVVTCVPFRIRWHSFLPLDRFTTDLNSHALSLEGPTIADAASSRELEDLLQAEGMFDTDEKALKREMILGAVDRLVQDWVTEETSKLPEFGDGNYPSIMNQS